ncbi:MAG: 50S ribosomal protein L29 [Bryocella sp.]
MNLDKEELTAQAHQAAEQIFRLRFQLRMGQNEGVKKLRELKKDIARIKTAERQRELGIAPSATPVEVKPKRAAKKAAKSKAAKGKSVKAKKLSKATSKKGSKTAGKAKAAGRTSMKSAKRGKANAKKGGS